MPATLTPALRRTRGPATATPRSAWWQSGVLYQIYPRSFADADGDGHGDLAGIRGRLDHLQDLGVDGIWLNPIHPSPNADWGYDVADYYAVHPDFGSLQDLEALIDDCHARGIRVILDLVPNHTSDEHPWFTTSRSSRENAKADWYVWADPAPGGGPPNNWVSMFGGSAWSFDETRGQYFLHNFTRRQPDLNWWSAGVRAEFDQILSFWARRGVDGFRIDVCQAIIKDRLLRDNPPADETDRTNVRLRGQKPLMSMNRPEVHEVLRSWRTLLERFPHKPILLGETNTHDLGALARFYGDGDELHMAFNFPFMDRPLDAAALRDIIAQTEQTLPAYAQPVWTMSNHDAPRFVERWAGGDQRKVRVALMLLLCLRGTPMLYYGDELGLGDAPKVPLERSRDPLAHGGLPGKESRDPSRAPMPWHAARADDADAPADPWLPAHAPTSVAEQSADPGSHLRFCRDLIALRRRRPELHDAPMRLPDAPDGVLALGRGPLRVLLNLTGETVTVPVTGRVLIGTERRQDGAKANGRLVLGPWQGAVLA